ncbi:hypothetical protein ACJQWY_02435 [Weissella kandleri]|uniref:hypothetical protein n=1 Tax=Weissella kandleri TaxID=1616 RepID=UPI00387EA2D1
MSKNYKKILLGLITLIFIGVVGYLIANNQHQSSNDVAKSSSQKSSSSSSKKQKSSSSESSSSVSESSVSESEQSSVENAQEQQTQVQQQAPVENSQGSDEPATLSEFVNKYGVTPAVWLMQNKGMSAQDALAATPDYMETSGEIQTEFLGQ